MSSWKELYFAAVLETNPQTLESLVHETEKAIHLRNQQLMISAWAAILELQAKLLSGAEPQPDWYVFPPCGGLA